MLFKTNQSATGRGICRGLMVIFSNDQSFTNQIGVDDDDSSNNTLETSIYIQKINKVYLWFKLDFGDFWPYVLSSDASSISLGIIRLL